MLERSSDLHRSSSNPSNNVFHFSNIGIEVGEVKLNLQKMMQNKDKAVATLTKGIEFLFKKNKVTYFKGFLSFCLSIILQIFYPSFRSRSTSASTASTSPPSGPTSTNT